MAEHEIATRRRKLAALQRQFRRCVGPRQRRGLARGSLDHEATLVVGAAMAQPIQQWSKIGCPEQRSVTFPYTCNATH